jgi:hypothetical protein
LPGRAGDEGPPGTVKVDFVSANPAARWDVYSDDQVICTTPCARFVHPAHPVMLRSRDEGFMSMGGDKVEVANLLEHPEPRLQLQAHPTSRGQWTTGIVFMTFSGMAVLTGIALTATGCPSGTFHSDGSCTGGLISMGVGTVALAGSLWLFLDARPHAEVTPYTEGGTVLALPAKPGVHVAPTGLWGTF